MNDSRSTFLSLVLIALLFVWIGCLFFIPPRVWLLPFAGSPGVLVGGSSADGPVLVVPPAREKRARKAPLAGVELTEGQSRLVVIGVADGAGFGLQINDRQTRKVIEILRVPSRANPGEHFVVLDSRRLPAAIQLVVWNRGRSELVIEGVELRDLRPGYRWARRLAWLIGPVLLIVLLAIHRQGLARYFFDGGGAEVEYPQRRWDIAVVALVFLFCFSVFYRSPVQQILDSKFITAVSHSLITNGSLALPANFVPGRRVDKIYALQRVDGKIYHSFSSAPAVLNVPFVALYEVAGISPVTSEGEFLSHNELRILRFAAAAVAAALCGVFFLTARVWLPPGLSLGLTLVFAFGTQIYSSISRPYWSHSWSSLLLATALFLLVSPRWKDRSGAYVLMSTLLCWAYFCRPPMSLAILGVALLILVTRRAFLGPFLVTGGIWASLFVLYSWRTFGSWLPPYFMSSHLESGRLAGGLLLSSYPKGVLGTLVSPGRGLFVYVPIFVLILWIVIRRWKWIPDKALAVTALGVGFAHWQLFSLFRNWWGGQSFGPRLMSDLVPWFFLLAVLGVAAMRAARFAGEFRWTSLKRVGVALIVTISIFINMRGAISMEAQRGAGIWNWRYPSFLAGIIPHPHATPAGNGNGPPSE